MTRPMFSWDRCLLEGPEFRVTHTPSGGVHLDFLLGTHGVGYFARAMTRLRETGFDNLNVPFFESTHLGVYLPRGYVVPPSPAERRLGISSGSAAPESIRLPSPITHGPVIGHAYHPVIRNRYHRGLDNIHLT